jgi:hypothetical protein
MVQFHGRMGGQYLGLKNPASGKKEGDMRVVSKTGPDGKELCG